MYLTFDWGHPASTILKAKQTHPYQINVKRIKELTRKLGKPWPETPQNRKDCLCWVTYKCKDKKRPKDVNMQVAFQTREELFKFIEEWELLQPKQKEDDI